MKSSTGAVLLIMEIFIVVAHLCRGLNFRSWEFITKSVLAQVFLNPMYILLMHIIPKVFLHILAIFCRCIFYPLMLIYFADAYSD